MAAVENAAPAVTSESKSARKKKAKAEAAAANGTNHTTPAVPEAPTKDDSAVVEGESSTDHPYLKELQKQIRNVNKKLAAMQKLDSILAENPGVSLDDLVAQRKINSDQKAAAQKKPHLLAQLADLDERQEHYRKFDAEYQVKFTKQRDELTSQHQQEVDRLKQQLRGEATNNGAAELRQKLLVFSQFLRAAAAKRTIEEEADTDESRAFEGALLLVYGGDEKAVDTAVSLIDGSEELVPSIEGLPLPVSYAQVKKAALDHAPFQTEEAWVDQVAEATGGDVPADSEIPSDPTITHAGLTEMDATGQPNGVHAEPTMEAASAGPVSAGDVGNIASERWDTDAAGAGAEKGGSLEESYEMIARPSDEVDVPTESSASAAPPQLQGTSWADDTTQEAATGLGNQAGEKWDTKAPGEQDNSWAAEPAGANGYAQASTEAVVKDDGFSEVPGRNRGRGGHRGRGDGEFRGRGGRRGNFRGRGDGERGRGGFRGNRGDGEFRGRGGRGRGGPRGGGDAGGS